MYDTRTRMANQVVEEVKTHFQDLVYDTVIHRNTKLSEAPSHGETIIMYDAASKGAIKLFKLCKRNFAKK
jgi:chromosome partitioning protein